MSTTARQRRWITRAYRADIASTLAATSGRMSTSSHICHDVLITWLLVALVFAQSYDTTQTARDALLVHVRQSGPDMAYVIRIAPCAYGQRGHGRAGAERLTGLVP
ncbi:MAG: hypothetical protein ACRD0K_20245 [Egibacteraceae bacterium]